MDCLEHMIKSTKDDHIEASDGNTFRVFLHCPNCRSNLGPSIRDTVLLRKVDKYSKQAFKDAHGGLDVVDEMLSASELRFKHALEKDETIASAIEAAKHREDDFFGRRVEVDEEEVGFPDVSNMGSSSNMGMGDSLWSFDDEEGFEADLANGPHNSFIFRHHSTRKLGIQELDDEPDMQKDVEADSTLLFGLDAFMTEQEEQFMTSQMISGDTAKLAAATEMMHYVSALSRQGMKPSPKRRRSSIALSNGQASNRRSMLASITEVIKEGNEARRKEEEKENRHAAGAVAAQLTSAVVGQFGGVAGGRRKLKHQVDMEMKMQMEHMRLHPLPLRMPKYAEVTAGKATSTGVMFVDDVWDGTVVDAFSKISVNKSLLGHITVKKQHAESMGIRHVIDAGNNPKSPRSNGKGYIDTPRPRVLVASISRELGRQGIAKGDVVTHFNGEAFSATASELKAFIEKRFEGEVMTFVFNADNAVAEALKRRSMIV